MLESSDFFVSLRPEILIDGTGIEKLSDNLLDMKLMSSIQGHAVACVRFLNWGTSSYEHEPDFLFFDQTYLDFGRKLSIRVKSEGSTLVLFSGHITAIETHQQRSSPPEIIITAEDRLADFCRQVRNRMFESVTDSDILTTIAGNHGLATNLALDGPVYERVVQLNQTDLAFCFERVRAAGGELWIEDETLHAATREERMSGPIDLTMGESLLEFQARADLAGQATELRATGWNVGQAQRITGTATDASVNSSALSAGQTAASILEELTGGDTLVHELKSLPSQEEQAQALAEQFYREKARGFVRAAGKASDTPQLRVGTVVNLAQVGSFFEGPYYVTAVTHIFSSLTGFQTEFEAERAVLHRKSMRRTKKEASHVIKSRTKKSSSHKPTPTRSRNSRRPVVRRLPRSGQRRKRS